MLLLNGDNKYNFTCIYRFVYEQHVLVILFIGVSSFVVMFFKVNKYV